MRLRLLLLTLLVPFLAFAQTGKITGQLTGNAGQSFNNLKIILKGTTYTTTTNEEGKFEFADIPFNEYVLLIDNTSFANFSKNISLSVAELSLDKILVEADVVGINNDNDIPTISLDETESQGNSEQNVSSVLNSSRDAFMSAVNFNFSESRFRIRGYDDENFVTQLNNVPVTDLVNGRTQYNLWSGLNDVMRARENNIGLAPANYSFGGVGGSFDIDSRATRQRKQLQATYSLSNRSFDNRFMLTYGSGILKNGWAVALSFSHRWAQEGFIKGTYFEGTSWFATVSKISGAHEFSFTTMNSKVENARTGASTQEVYDLTGDNHYNPNWGYQNGEVRSATIGRNQQPVFILGHEYKINSKSFLETSVAYTKGKRESTALDWYNTADPRASYYSYLPSVYDDPTLSNFLQSYISNNPEVLQLNWDKLYQANISNIDSVENVNGIAGNNVVGKRSLYIIENRINEVSRFTFNTVYNRNIKDNIDITAGLNYQKQSNNYYKEVEDLLGGDFYSDVNKFAETDSGVGSNATQNDLNNPNRILKEGDKFGYDYEAHISKTAFWVQSVIKFNNIDLFAGIELASTTFYREGNYKNGLFPDNSFGKSDKESFFDPSFKAGATYKINGRNYLYANGAITSRAPYFENAYIAPRTRDFTVEDLTSEKILSFEGGYLLRAPKLKVRATGFFTKFKDGTEIKSYYVENIGNLFSDGEFVNSIQTNIEKTHVGAELAGEGNLGKGFTATAVAALGQYYYSDRPLVTIISDNTNEVQYANETVYAKNLHVATGPQTAYSLGMNYRSPKFWFVSANFNLVGNTYVDYSPERKLLKNLDLVDKDSEYWNYLLGQTRFGMEPTLNLSAGWSYKLNNKFKSLKRNTFFLVNLGVSNVLDNNDIVTSGYEQGRIRKDTFESTGKDLFAPKYTYGFGRTFFLSFILRMN